MSTNLLYDKFRIRVFAVRPLSSDAVGSQTETFDQPYLIRANVQLDKAGSPTDPITAGPHGGKIFTQKRGALKERDRIEFEGYLYIVRGVRNLYDHLTSAYHHTEATIEITESKVL
jgi:hypothetical protein